jgi:non-homologous end joining protein Ku
MASTSWRGAIEFGGFAVNIALQPRVKSRSGESFKTMAPNGHPVRSVYMDTDDNEVSRDACSKGVKVGTGKQATFKVLSEEALEQIENIAKSTIVPPTSYAPLDTVPLELATSAFAVVPDSNVPGSEQNVNTVWNGLRAQRVAYTTEVTMRAGSRDAVLVLYADDRGLWAVALPFAEELHPEPEFGFTENEQAAELFAQFTEGEVRDFDLGDYKSQWRERRQAAIDAALDGKPVETVAAAEQAPVPDLMAALKSSVQASKGKKPAKKKAPVAA